MDGVTESIGFRRVGLGGEIPVDDIVGAIVLYRKGVGFFAAIG